MFSPQLAVGAVIFALILLLSSADAIIDALRQEDLLVYGFHGQAVYAALSSDAAAFFIPIICTLPFTAAYVDDIKTRFARYYLGRTSYGAYIRGRIAGCIVSGGAVLALGVLLAYGAAALAFMPLEEALKAGDEAPGWFAKTLGAAGRVFLSGSLWAMVGMALSSFMESRYIAYASPFVIYYILIILYERYFDRLYVIYPREWLFPSGIWAVGAWGAPVLTAELTVLFAVLFALRADRRLREL